MVLAKIFRRASDQQTEETLVWKKVLAEDADNNFKMRIIGILALFLRPSQT